MKNTLAIAAVVLFTCVSASGQRQMSGDYTIVSLNNENQELMEIALDGTIMRTAPTGAEPHEVQFSPDGRIFVTNTLEPSISMIDRDSFEVVGQLESPYFGGPGNQATGLPHGMAMSHDGDTLYVTTERYEKPGVLALDWKSGRSRKYIETGQQGGHLVRIHPSLDRAYVMNRRSSSISVIDTRRDVLEKNIETPGGPIGLDFATDGDLWVATRDGAVHIIDTGSGAVRKSLTGQGTGNGRMYLSPDGRIGVATHADGADVFDAESEKWLSYFPLENDPSATGIKHAIYLCFSPDSERMYLSLINASSVLIMDTRRFEEVARWKLPKRAYTVDIAFPQN